MKRAAALGAAAVTEGRFAEELAPDIKKTRKGELVIDTDDHIKPDTSIEVLAKLRAAFGKEGTVTAGNASGIVDGAAAVILAAEDCPVAQNREVLGTLRGWNVVGVDPSVMGIGPAPAISGLLAASTSTFGL